MTTVPRPDQAKAVADVPRIPRRAAVLGITLALLLGLALWFQHHFTFGVNLTHSLHGSLFLIHKGQPARRGEYVAFHWRGGGPYAAGAIFVKQLVGLPGDRVSRNGAHFLVNGRFVGTAKAVSRDGKSLTPGPTGVLPPGHYFVATPHPDSLDSRYAITGWIRERDLIGRAHALF